MNNLRQQPKLLTTSVPFAVVVDPALDDSRVRLGWPVAGSVLGNFILYVGPNASLTEEEIAYYARVCERHPHADSVLAMTQGEQPARKKSFIPRARRRGRKARRRKANR